MSPVLAIVIIFFFATFTQSVSGFGGALVAMPLLTAGILPLEVAAPLFALGAIASRPFMLLRYRSALSLNQIWRVLIAAVIAIPLGVELPRIMDEQIIRTILAVVVIGYVLMNLMLEHLPKLNHTLWGWGLGFIGGLLAGAYNIGGPPVVIYATGRRWLANEFRANMQTYSIINNVVVILAHARLGNLTPNVFQYFVLIIPSLAVGLLLGFALNNHINQALFRKLVLALLFVSGVRLLF